MSGEDQIRRGGEYITRNYGNATISTWTYSSPPLPASYSITTGVPAAACPDLLRYEQIGEADRLRGRVVRAFFWLLRAWPP